METDDTSGEVSVVDVARVEITRQTVILVFGIAGTVASVYIARRMQDELAMSIVKMQGALWVKRWADKWSDRFTRLSGWAANVYNGEKL